MNKKFIEKVICERIVDTKQYRYVAHDDGHKILIKRIDINALDTTAALEEWETVVEL